MEEDWDALDALEDRCTEPECFEDYAYDISDAPPTCEELDEAHDWELLNSSTEHGYSEYSCKKCAEEWTAWM